MRQTLPGNSFDQTDLSKMAAAMDVDTPTGANSGASKKRFEVKKVCIYNRITYCGLIISYNYLTSLNVGA